MNFGKRCTSCHICHTSQTRAREFVPCTTCNSIVCEVCFDTRLTSWRNRRLTAFDGHSPEGSEEEIQTSPEDGFTWEEACVSGIWRCPACRGVCHCSRCEHKARGQRARNIVSPHTSLATSHSPNLQQYSRRNRKTSSLKTPKVSRKPKRARASPPAIPVSEDDDEEEQELGEEQQRTREKIRELLKKERRCNTLVRQTELLLSLMRDERTNITQQLAQM